MQKKKKISAQEMDQIAVRLASGLSLRKIAKELGRSVSSISDEIKRNGVKGEYKSIAANSWLFLYNQRSKKKGHYWGAAKKQGTSFTLSEERQVATSIG